MTVFKARKGEALRSKEGGGVTIPAGVTESLDVVIKTKVSG